MKETVKSKLKSMRLNGLLSAFEAQDSDTSYHDMSFSSRFELLIEAEYLRRDSNRLKRRYSESGLEYNSSISEVDFREERKLDKAKILELTEFGWVNNYNDLIITGLTGSGKSFLASAIGDAGIKKSLKVKYFKVYDLIQEFRIEIKNNSSYLGLIKKLKSFDILIFDEWLRDNFDIEESRFILDLIDSRYREKSNIFVSQLPTDTWHGRLGEPTIADAIMDRIIHDSIKIQMKGESMRKLTAKIVGK